MLAILDGSKAFGSELAQQYDDLGGVSMFHSASFHRYRCESQTIFRCLTQVKPNCFLPVSSLQDLHEGI